MLWCTGGKIYSKTTYCEGPKARLRSLVPSVTQWLTQNAGTSADARLDDRDQVEVESDGEGVGN